jgi:hypothetical protein
MVRLSLLLLLAACAGSDDKETGGLVDTAPDFVDADGDGVPSTTDCNDADEYTYPGAREVPYDGRDQDCDGEDVVDVDGDGHVGDAAGGDDCNDSNPAVHPGAEVVCYDLIDEDCSEGWSQYDCDSDGFELSEDCGDEDPTIYPGAEDVWYDGVDQDCDARDDYDQDEDGYRSSAHPDAAGEIGTDCDDLEPAVNEAAAELWDGVDNDCDGGQDTLTNRDTDGAWYGDGYAGESYFGWDFEPIGDLDGDGRLDIAVGVLGYNEFAGRAYVLPYGEGLNVPTTDAFATIDGTSYLGSAVSAVQGPGGTLVAVGEAGTASVHLFEASALTGGASLTSADAVATISSASSYIGGDLDPWSADGTNALMVASFAQEGLGTYVALFDAADLSGAVTDAAALWSWTGSGDIYDAAVVGDVDGDGGDDVVIGSSGFSGSARAALVTSGTIASGENDTSTASFSGFSGAVTLGTTADIDGDGYRDFLVSDTLADGAGSAAGQVWLLPGGSALSSAAAADVAIASILGVADDGALRAATVNGDIDGDGHPDVVVCAPGDGASSLKGACSWVSGVTLAGGGELEPGIDGPTFSSVGFDDQYGADAKVLDVDGDLDDDVLLSGTGDAGGVFLYLKH